MSEKKKKFAHYTQGAPFIKMLLRNRPKFNFTIISVSANYVTFIFTFNLFSTLIKILDQEYDYNSRDLSRHSITSFYNVFQRNVITSMRPTYVMSGGHSLPNEAQLFGCCDIQISFPKIEESG